MRNSLSVVVLATCLMFSAVGVEGDAYSCTWTNGVKKCQESSGDSAYATSTSVRVLHDQNKVKTANRDKNIPLGDGQAYAGPGFGPIVVPGYPFPFGGRRR